MRYIRDIYLNNVLFFVLIGIVVLFALGFFWPIYMALAKPILIGVVLLLFIDVFILFSNENGVEASRETMDKLSNGDDNPVRITVQNTYVFPIGVRVIDELPKQFQEREQHFDFNLSNGYRQEIDYEVHPTERGEYHWGAVNVFVSSPLRLVSRRYRFDADTMVPVYPSFMQMRKYELLAISNRLMEVGVKKMRRIGHNNEFEQIKEYVQGDDFRTVNWKATARRGSLMVNQYQDEKSQQVYSVVDMGRLMQMPFDGMSLLDYSINASLVLSNIAMHKGDKAGLMTFSHKTHTLLKASRRASQLQHINELLYNQRTGFLETDFQRLYVHMKREITTRSLLLIYTNFESLTGLRRQLPFFRRMSKDHVVVVIFFENTELADILNRPATTTEQIYGKTIAEKFDYEKRQIVKELKKFGIYAVLTPPDQLTVNTINQYLELKARGVI